MHWKLLLLVLPVSHIFPHLLTFFFTPAFPRPHLSSTRRPTVAGALAARRRHTGALQLRRRTAQRTVHTIELPARQCQCCASVC